MSCRSRVVAAAMLAGLLGAPAFGHAQEAPVWEIGGGIRLLGALGVARADARQTAGDRSPLTLFATETTIARSAGWQATVGRRLTATIVAEALLAVQPTSLSTLVTGDLEGAAGTLATSSLTLLQLEGGVRWMPERGRLTTRTRLFGAAGGGYVRQMHGGRTFIQSAGTASVGGGVLRSMWRNGDGREVSARIEGRAALLRGGVAERISWAPLLTAGVIVGL